MKNLQAESFHSHIYYPYYRLTCRYLCFREFNSHIFFVFISPNFGIASCLRSGEVFQCDVPGRICHLLHYNTGKRILWVSESKNVKSNELKYVKMSYCDGNKLQVILNTHTIIITITIIINRSCIVHNTLQKYVPMHLIKTGKEKQIENRVPIRLQLQDPFIK